MERDITEFQGAQLFQIQRILRFSYILCRIEYPKQALSTGTGPRKGVDQHANLSHRLLENGHEGQEGGQHAQADLAIPNLLSSKPEHQRHRGEEGQRHHRVVGSADEDLPVKQLQRLGGGFIVFLQLMISCVKRSHNSNAVEVFIHHLGQQ